MSEIMNVKPMVLRLSGALLLIALWTVAGASQAAGLMDKAAGMANPLAGMLEDQLGVSADQAEGGLGSILSLASEKLSSGDYDKLLGSIPGAEGYLQSAKDLGAISGPLSSLGDLNEALGRLGLSPEKAAAFLPKVTELVGKVGGEDAARLLGSVLGGG